MRRAYERHRHTSTGIFLARPMPGWQAVVPPWRAIGLWLAGVLVSIALTSAACYGPLTVGVSTLAAILDAVLRPLADVDRASGKWP